MIRNIELVDFLAHSNTKLGFENDATVFVGNNGAVSYTHLTLPTNREV